KTETSASWRLSTHPMRAFGGGQQAPQQRIVANGVIATLSRLNSSTEVTIKTAQGNFTFKPAETGYGKPARFLGGRAVVDRVPASAAMRTPNEQDFPAAVTDRNGTVWVAYQEFTPNPKFVGVRNLQIEPISNFDELTKPTGGDQIFLTSFTQGKWSEPVAVCEPKGDLYKTAVAIDGTGRVWVFWTGGTQQDGAENFDLYARAVVSGKGGGTLKLTAD